MELDKETTKKLQEKILKIFIEFKKICEDNGLKYYLIGGSCLGAVRHKGFIPWDDDIDVGMPREDFTTFCRIAPQFLSQNLFLQTYESDPQYYFEFAKIRDSNTTYLDSGMKQLDINHGIFMDIFPLDSYPNSLFSKFKLRFNRALYDNYIQLRHSKIEPENRSVQKKIMQKLSCRIVKSEIQAKASRTALFQQVSNKPGKFVANYYGAWAKKEICPTRWFGDGISASFEGYDVKIPKEYDSYLSQLYGDYMKLPPIEKRVSHHHCDVIDLDTSYKYYTKAGHRMKRVITYGTFDLLHYGHINLLRRAKELGDYLVVAISTDEFNWDEKHKRCYFTYEQRKALVEAIRYVDLVIPETNWEQKKTDVHEYHIDTFVIGNDWKGKFDFLKDEGVEVIYLPRTPEVSSSQIKADLSIKPSRGV